MRAGDLFFMGFLLFAIPYLIIKYAFTENPDSFFSFDVYSIIPLGLGVIIYWLITWFLNKRYAVVRKAG